MNDDSKNRAIVTGSIVFTLIGGAVGICVSMLCRQDPSERAHVYIDDSFPFLIGGSIVGCLVGVIVFAACSRWLFLQPLANIVGTILLEAAIAAPHGWIVGDSLKQRHPVQGIVVGGMVGAEEALD